MLLRTRRITRRRLVTGWHYTTKERFVDLSKATASLGR